MTSGATRSVNCRKLGHYRLCTSPQAGALAIRLGIRARSHDAPRCAMGARACRFTGFIGMGCDMDCGPRVSVVMPVHNAAAYVERAVRSALASDLHELEVIVVDDGSEDESAAIVAAIADPRIVLLRMPPSGGPSRPRNAGIARARAPYVALLDSDDELKPHKLLAAADALDRYPHAGFAFTDSSRLTSMAR